MLEVYGIPNCDTVKRSLGWLKKNKVAFRFHDLKTEALSANKLTQWVNKAGLDIVVNKKSTTWRNLPAAVQQQMEKKPGAIKIMQEHTSIIRRPVIENGDELTFGFNEAVFSNFI